MSLSYQQELFARDKKCNLNCVIGNDLQHSVDPGSQFMQVLMAEHSMFFAWYCWQVTSGMEFLYTHALAMLESPPLQVPAVPQLISACTEGITSLWVPKQYLSNDAIQ